jgi:hypothetical protein
MFLDAAAASDILPTFYAAVTASLHYRYIAALQ